MNQYLTNACGGCGSKKKKKAFTLIELLIVITIIGILAVALLPRVLNAPARARDTQRKTDLSRITLALENYYNDFGTYPIATSGACLTSASGIGQQLAAYFTDDEIPVDPLGAIRLSPGIVTPTACGDTGYWYRSMSLEGNVNMAYVLATDTEIDPVATVAPFAPGYMSNVSTGALADSSTYGTYTLVNAVVDSGEASPTLYAVMSR